MKNAFCVMLLLILSVMTPISVFATTLFFEDFESDLSQFTTVGHGVIVQDPRQSDHALTFTRLMAGGDMLSRIISNATGRYILSFDYLGTSNSTNCGGFIGYEPGDVWLGGTGSGYADLLPDTGAWERVTLTFSGPTSIRLQLEDFSGSGGIPGDAFFDNILVTDLAGPDPVVDPVPEPATVLLLGSGMLGLMGLKRKKQR